MQSFYSDHLEKWFKKSDLRRTVAQLAAMSGFTFNQIATCSFLQDTFEKTFSSKVQNHKTVRSYVSSYANEKRQELAQKFMELKASGSRFSMSSDEWTSASATRYLNIVLKASDEHHNLGLERIRGKADAQNINLVSTSPKT